MDYCEICGAEVVKDTAIVILGDRYCDDCAETNTMFCVDCGKDIKISEMYDSDTCYNCYEFIGE